MLTSASIAVRDDRVPDWDNVTLDLSCARCGYNLYMLPTPRCPECGLAFQWAEVIAAAKRKLESPLFEYQWRHRPIRSLLQTAGLSLVPWWLWSRTPLTLEPKVGPLLALLPLVGFLYMVLACVRLHAWYWFDRAYLASTYGMSKDPFWTFWSLENVLREAVLPSVFAFVIWLAIQLFQQTITRYRIRQDQLLRIVIHAWIGVMMSRAILEVLCKFSQGLGHWWNGQYLYFPDYLAAGVAVAWLLLSICPAFAIYLKVRGGWLWAILVFVFASTMVFAVITAASLYVFDSLANPLTNMLDRWGPNWRW